MSRPIARVDAGDSGSASTDDELVAPPRIRHYVLGISFALLGLSAICVLLLAVLPSKIRNKRAVGGLPLRSAMEEWSVGLPDGIDYSCFEESVDLYGYDLPGQPLEATTALDCKSLCEAEAACKYFTWNSDGSGECYLKSSDRGRKAWGHKVSGPRQCLLSPHSVDTLQLPFAKSGLCNASLAHLENVTARIFHMPPNEEAWCKSDAAKPVGTWSWPGRNWCWLHAKMNACYEGYGQGLPNWYWAQDKAANEGHAPKPTDVLLNGMQNPTMCDLPELGAPLKEISPQERTMAGSWFNENINVYVVNLPQSKERWVSMKERLTSLGINPIRILGIDVSKPGGIAEAQAAGYIPSNWNYDVASQGVKWLYSESDQPAQKKFFDAMGVGTVGCAAAHLNAQRAAANLTRRAGKQLALIMEDDVWTVDDFVVKLYRLLRDEAPCDWDVMALSSRCSFGICVAPHLSRVQPDGNEPTERCHTGTNFGMYGTLYRVSEIEHVNQELMKIMWDDSHAGCLPIDVAMAAISDKIGYYAVPHSQNHGFVYEMTSNWAASARRSVNGQT